MIELTITGEVSVEEAEKYVSYLQTKYNRKLQWLDIRIDGDEVELSYKFVPIGFERIRRITGYLTGDTSTWNDAKKHELEDRVTHGGMIDLSER